MGTWVHKKSYVKAWQEKFNWLCCTVCKKKIMKAATVCLLMWRQGRFRMSRLFL